MAKLSFVKAELTVVDFHLYVLNEELDRLSSLKRTQSNLKKINEKAPILYDLLQRMNELLIIHLYNFFEIKKDLNFHAKSNKKIRDIMKALNPSWKKYLEPIQGIVNDTRESILAHGSVIEKKGFLGLNDIVKSQKKFFKKTVLASKVAQMYADAVISHRGGGKGLARDYNMEKNVPQKVESVLPEDYFKMHRVAHRIQKEIASKLKEISVIYTNVKFARKNDFPKKFRICN